MPNLRVILDIIGYLLVINGVLFSIITAIAMLRFPDFYARLHASSKCLTGGAISILLGSIFLVGFNTLSFKLFLLIIFLAITNPVTAHAIANTAYRVGLTPKVLKDDLEKKGDR